MTPRASQEDHNAATERANWLHKHRAPSDWVILTESEIAAIRADLVSLQRRLEEAEGREAVQWDQLTAIYQAARSQFDKHDSHINSQWVMDAALAGMRANLNQGDKET